MEEPDLPMTPPMRDAWQRRRRETLTGDILEGGGGVVRSRGAGAVGWLGIRRRLLEEEEEVVVVEDEGEEALGKAATERLEAIKNSGARGGGRRTAGPRWVACCGVECLIRPVMKRCRLRR